jgi:hypothetical protein
MFIDTLLGVAMFAALVGILTVPWLVGSDAETE